jgi:pre-mRNA-splicing factor SYF1
MAALDALLPDEADLVFEEELLRNATDIKVWLRYLAARKDAVSRKRHLLYERAVAALPGSYKLWHAYLRERVEEARGLPPGSPAHEALHNTFERALVTMHKMPRIWELYLRSLLDQKLVTRTRRACDRALAALPVTQHERVWTIFLVRGWRSYGFPASLSTVQALTRLARRLHGKTACQWRLR